MLFPKQDSLFVSATSYVSYLGGWGGILILYIKDTVCGDWRTPHAFSGEREPSFSSVPWSEEAVIRTSLSLSWWGPRAALVSPSVLRVRPWSYSAWSLGPGAAGLQHSDSTVAGTGEYELQGLSFSILPGLPFSQPKWGRVDREIYIQQLAVVPTCLSDPNLFL